MAQMRYKSFTERNLIDSVLDYGKEEAVTNSSITKTQTQTSKNNQRMKLKNQSKNTIPRFFSGRSTPLNNSVQKNIPAQNSQRKLRKPKSFSETSRMNKITPKDDPERVTKFIKYIYEKYNDNTHSQGFSDVQNKDYLSPKPQDDKTFINPKLFYEQRKKIKCSKAKQSFLDHYNSLFLVDGKLQLTDNMRAVDNIIFSQLSASALSSHKWKSVLTKRRSLYSTSQALELNEYPLDQKEANHQKQKRVFSNYKMQNETFIKEFQKRQLNEHQIYGSSKSEYSDILHYMDHIKGSDLGKSLDQANAEVSFIKERAKYFQRIKDKHQKKQIYSQRTSSKERHTFEDVFPVRPNKILNSNIILREQVKPPLVENVSRYYNEF